MAGGAGLDVLLKSFAGFATAGRTAGGWRARERQCAARGEPAVEKARPRHGTVPVAPSHHLRGNPVARRNVSRAFHDRTRRAWKLRARNREFEIFFVEPGDRFSFAHYFRI
jgi:hypothetical protein